MKATHGSFNISFVTGPPGSGKSYAVTRDLLERLEDPNFTGKIITNLPLNVDKVCDYIGKRTNVHPDSVRERIMLLDKETLSWWADGKGGPWDLTAKGLAEGNELVLDECHLFCVAAGQNVKVRGEQWTKWLGEVRHEGWRRVMFMTQDESKVGKPIKSHAEMRFELTNTDKLRDPLLKIPLGYWQEVIASFRGEYRSTIAIVELRRTGGKLVAQHRELVPLDPWVFQFYNSFEAAGGGTGRGAGSSAAKREWERRPRLLPTRRDGVMWLPTWLWVVRKFWGRFMFSGAVTIFACYMFFGGGFAGMIGNVSTAMLRTVDKKKAKTVDQVEAGGQANEASGGGEVEPQRGSLEQLREALAMLPEKQRGYVLGELRAAADEQRELQEQVDKFQAEQTAAITSMKVVAVTPTQAWFTHPPCICQVGKEIPEGPHKGKILRKINVKEGWIELAHGVRLYVGGVADSGRVQFSQAQNGRPLTPYVGPATPVSGDLRPVDAWSAATGIYPPGTTQSYHVGDGNAGRGVLSTPGERSILKRGGSGGVGRPAVDAGAEGSTAGRSAEPGGEAAGRGGSERGDDSVRGPTPATRQGSVGAPSTASDPGGNR